MDGILQIYFRNRKEKKKFVKGRANLLKIIIIINNNSKHSDDNNNLKSNK